MTRYVYDDKTFRLSRLKSEKYTYSNNGNEHYYAYNSGTTKQDYGYVYDLAGNILKIKNRTPDCGTSGTPDTLDRDFTYDPLYRLLTATGRESDTQSDSYTWNDAPAPGTPNASNARGYTREYDYDKMGNIQEIVHQATGNNFTRNFNYNSNKNTLSSIDDGQDPATDYSTFSFDTNGNMITSNTTRNYEWDHSDQLRAYYNQTGTSEPTVYAHYLYDAGGNRVKKLVRTQGGDYEVIVYIDGIFEYHKKISGANTYEKNELHIMDDNSRIAMKRIGTAYPDDISDAEVYILEDHLGSSSVRLNANGTVIDREEYYPFGDSSLRTFSKKRYRFTGKEKDSESGLYYYGARYYAAWTGRFISVDNMALTYVHLTPYNYAGNKPISYKDLLGNQSNKPDEDKKSPSDEKKTKEEEVKKIEETQETDIKNGASTIRSKILDEVQEKGTEITKESQELIEKVQEDHIKVGTNKKIYKSPGITKAGKWKDVGNQYFTSKGVNKIKKLDLTKFKFIGKVMESAVLLDSIISLATFVTSEEQDPFALLPTSFITDINNLNLAALDQMMLQKAIEKPYKEAKAIIEGSKRNPKNQAVKDIIVMEVTQDVFLKVMSGEIDNFSELRRELNSNENYYAERNYGVIFKLGEDSKIHLLVGYGNIDKKE